ncbi:MAG: hypothetical protein JRI55_39135, partial [Deltaproteobacteria bacterium]|nr:hypothetical protein [Deltaproteobacteria bacterium]
MTRQKWLVCARLLPVALLGAQLALSWGFAAAGVAREMCFARTVAEGWGLALQPGATWSLGFDSLPWTLVLALAQLAGLPLLPVAKVLGALLGGVALYLLPRVSATLEGRGDLQPLDLVPALVLSAHPGLARLVAGGPGTSLVLLLVVVALGLFAIEERRFQQGQRRGLLASAAPLLLLLVASPVAWVLVLAVVVARLLSRVTAGRFCWQDAAWCAAPLIVQGALLLAAYAVFADPWPGLLGAREALPETRLGSDTAIRTGWGALRHVMQGFGVTAPLVGLAAVGALRHRIYWARFAALSLGLAAAATVIGTGGDPSGRWAAPALLALALLAGSGIAWVLVPLRQILAPSRLRRAALWAVGLGLLAGPGAAAVRALASPPASPFHRDQRLVGWLRGHLERMGLTPEGVTVLTDRPGAMALQGFRVVDATGATDPSVRRHNGLQHPLELGQLVRERSPDVLVERPPWRHVHDLGRRPENGRRYVRVRFGEQPSVRISLSRRLVLEPAPWPDRPMRQPLGRGLILLGGRAVSGGLALLWMAADNGPAQRHVRVSVGRWSVKLPVGPALYPMPRWRAGEVVRQVVPLPGAAPLGGLPWVEVDGAR